MPCRHIFGPSPPLAKPCVSAPSLRADPDCRALRLLSRLRALCFAKTRSRHARCFRPCGTKAPSLTVSAVGVFAADTQLASLALRHGASPGPSAPCRWAACGGLWRISDFGEYCAVLPPRVRETELLLKGAFSPHNVPTVCGRQVAACATRRGRTGLGLRGVAAHRPIIHRLARPSPLKGDGPPLPTG